MLQIFVNISKFLQNIKTQQTPMWINDSTPLKKTRKKPIQESLLELKSAITDSIRDDTDRLADTLQILYFGHPKICCNHRKSRTRWLFLRVMHPKYAKGITNSVDPDQTALLGAI